MFWNAEAKASRVAIGAVDSLGIRINFHKPASKLSAYEAARMGDAVLP